jgi:hypothetical protein
VIGRRSCEVVDELGFVSFERAGGELLFNLLPRRRAPPGGKMNITHRSGVHFFSAILISF